MLARYPLMTGNTSNAGSLKKDGTPDGPECRALFLVWVGLFE